MLQNVSYDMRYHYHTLGYQPILAEVLKIPNIVCNCPEVRYCVQASGGRGVGLNYVKLSHVRLSMVSSSKINPTLLFLKF